MRTGRINSETPMKKRHVAFRRLLPSERLQCERRDSKAVQRKRLYTSSAARTLTFFPMGCSKKSPPRHQGATYSVLGSGFWVLGSGFWVLGFGFWVVGSGFWVLGSGFWVLGSGSWVLGAGFWRILAPGSGVSSGSWLCPGSWSWVLDPGSFFRAPCERAVALQKEVPPMLRRAGARSDIPMRPGTGGGLCSLDRTCGAESGAAFLY